MGPQHSADRLNATEPSRDEDQRGKERKSVTDTDLITAGGSDIDCRTVNPHLPAASRPADTAAPRRDRRPRAPRGGSLTDHGAAGTARAGQRARRQGRLGHAQERADRRHPRTPRRSKSGEQERRQLRPSSRPEPAGTGGRRCRRAGAGRRRAAPRAALRVARAGRSRGSRPAARFRTMQRPEARRARRRRR